MVFKKFSSTLTRSSSYWLMLARFAFWSSVNTRGNDFAATRYMLNFSVRITWHDPKWCLHLQQSVDSQTAILESQITNCIDVNVVCWRGSSSTSGIFIHLSSSCFETTIPLKTLRSAHTFVSEGLLKHFPRFSSSFPEFEAKFHTHTHVVLSSPSFSLPKKIASRSLHLFTSVALARLLAVIEWCGKKRCVTKGYR